MLLINDFVEILPYHGKKIAMLQDFRLLLDLLKPHISDLEFVCLVRKENILLLWFPLDLKVTRDLSSL